MMALLRFIFCSTLLTGIGVSPLWAQTSSSGAAPNVPAAAAQNKTPDKTQDKVQSFNFEDELVEGTAQKPEFFYLFQKKNFNYKRLIRLRENFIPEMRRNAEDIQRLRGGR